MAPVPSLPLVRDTASEAAEGTPAWAWPLLIVGGVALTAGVAYVIWGGSSGARRPRKAPLSPTGGSRATPPTGAPPLDDEPEELPTDPFSRAVSLKNKGNKYFKGGRYELAIKCYTEAIDICPEDKKQDLSTFFQNRAAAYDQLENFDSVIHDCTRALALNSKYMKAMERRAKSLRKQVQKQTMSDADTITKLKTALEDMTAVCILDGFQRQDHLILVDTILKELGRAEAKVAVKTRKPTLTSSHFIQQYFQSFAEDPIMKLVEKESESDADESDEDNSLSGFAKAIKLVKSQNFSDVVKHCTEEIESEGSSSGEAKLLRGTLYILSKQHQDAFQDFNQVIEDEGVDSKLRVNALIKRASLYIQQCKDPIKDPEMSFEDFKRAEEIDNSIADIYHHRGQVLLLVDKIDQALADFTKAVELNPGFPIAYVQKLYTEYRKASNEGKNTEVTNLISLFEQAMEKFPKCVETFALFAQVLSDQQEFDRAEDVYQKAQKADPQNANIMVHRGLIALQSKGDIEGSISLIRKALEIDEQCEFAYETLGTIEVQRGNLKQAIELFDKAIPIANTELEMAHLFGLKNAAIAQISVSDRLGINLPSPMGM